MQMACTRFIVINSILGIFAVSLLTACLMVLHTAHRTNTSNHAFNYSNRSKIAEHSYLRKTEKCRNVCVSKDCIYQSSALLKSRDDHEDKCENFYKYVCGMYPEDTYHIPGRTISPAFNQRFETPMYAKLQRIQKLESSETTIGSKRELIYESCMKSSGGKSEIKHLLSVVSSVFGDWPIAETDNRKSDVDKWLAEFFLMGEFLFFELNIVYKNPEMMRNVFPAFAQIIPPGMKSRAMISVSPDCNFMSGNSAECESGFFHEYLMDILTSGGLAEEIALKILTDACRLDELLRDACTGTYVRKSMVPQTDCGHWCRVLIQALDSVNSKINVSSIAKHINRQSELDSIISILDEEQPSAIANYLAVRFLYDNMEIVGVYTNRMGTGMLNDEMLAVDYLVADRSSRCFLFLLNHFPFTFVKEYLNSSNALENLGSISQICESIKQELVSLISSSTFSDSLKDKFRFSIHSIDFTVHTVDYIKHYIMDIWNGTNSFKYISPVHGNFVANIIQAKRSKQLDKILHNDDGDAFFIFKYKNNFHSNGGSGGQIDLGFAFLDYLTDSNAYISFSDYVAIGVILSHEFGHSTNKYIFNNLEYGGPDSTVFKNFTDCLIRSYSMFQMPYIQKYLDGSHTVEENRADFLGLQAFYEVTRKTIPNKLQNGILPGLNLTLDELFFSLRASSWCEINDRSGYKLNERNVHPPSELRINGPMMFSEKFSSILNCSSEQRMNPTEKCMI